MKEKSGKNKRLARLVLIDANAIIHRAFHALPPLTSPKGEPTNAVYGFTTILLRILRELKPDYIVGAFDTPKPTFRHAAYAGYKATRAKTPDELVVQIPRTKEILLAFGFPVFEKEGFEADDIIGTLTSKAENRYHNLETVIVTGDMDTLQLVSQRTKVWTMKKGISDTVFYDPEAVQERFGISPESVPDYKGLRGDPSDNILGVKGIGEKTAGELLQKYKTLEKLYGALEDGKLAASDSVKIKLREGKDDAFFSRTLATIRRDVPIEFRIESLNTDPSLKKEVLGKLFRELGFFSLLKRLDDGGGGSEKKPAVRPASEQGLLITGASLPGFSVLKKELNKKWPDEIALEFFPEKSEAFLALRDGQPFLLSLKDSVSPEIKKLFEGETIKYIFDAKPFYKTLKTIDVFPKGIFDLMLANYLLRPGQGQYLLDDLYVSELRLDRPPEKFEKITRLFELGRKIRTHLKDEDLLRVFETIELPLTPILAATELRGIRLDVAWLKKLAGKIDRELIQLNDAIYKDAGTSFNIDSPQQVSEVLFSKLGIGTKGIRKTDGGKISTKFSELVKLAGRHPIVEKILRHRELYKLKTTYVDTLPGFIGKDGRLHTTYNQVRTETGRLASENPNLQNIPIRSEFGRDVRRAFVAEKGWRLASFDYSQIELRIAADLSGDDKMIDAFKKGFDIHALTAAEVNDVSLGEVTPELRRKAKALNFGVLYGMGARGFAESAGISVEEARLFIEEYFNDFKGIADFIEKTKEFAREHGFVKTAFGRKRYLPGITSSNPMIRSEAERMAVNMPVQGTATGDIMKLAMIAVDRYIAEHFPGQARILLQIHDELLCEIEDPSVKEISGIIRSVMEGVWRGRVQLKVDLKYGKNWAEL